MRQSLTVALLALGAAAAFAAIVAIASLPEAVARMNQEPEDVYLLVFWVAVSSGLSVFWLGAAAHQAAGIPERFSRLLRFGAKLVVGLGLLFAVFVPVAEVDTFLAVLLAVACLFSGLAVHRSLGHRGAKYYGA